MNQSPTPWSTTIRPSNTDEYRQIKQVLNTRGGFGGYDKEPTTDSCYSKHKVVNETVTS